MNSGLSGYDGIPSPQEVIMSFGYHDIILSLFVISISDVSENGLRLTFAVFDNTMFFWSPEELNGPYKTNSKVISAAFNGVPLDNLPEPVVAIFQPVEVP